MHNPLVIFTLLKFATGTAADYRILKIAPGADMDTVKTAYRSEALKWHPDRNTDPQASEQFVAIAAAYENIKAESSKAKAVPVDAFKTFNDFMGTSFSFSFGSGNGKMSGTSQSTSTIIQNGKRVTKTVVKDLATGASETTVEEEDLSTGSKSTRRLVNLNSYSIELYS